MLGIVFRRSSSAEIFYDALEVWKGASFGTNFTLCIPFVILGHFHELDYVESLGVARHTIRLSVGLENGEGLLRKVNRALRAVEAFEENLGM